MCTPVNTFITILKKMAAIQIQNVKSHKCVCRECVSVTVVPESGNESLQSMAVGTSPLLCNHTAIGSNKLCSNCKHSHKPETSEARD